MEKVKIERINELAHKQQAEGLTEAEKAEQAALRAEYIRDFRASFGKVLDNTVVQYPDGSRTHLTDLKDQKKK